MVFYFYKERPDALANDEKNHIGENAEGLRTKRLIIVLMETLPNKSN